MGGYDYVVGLVSGIMLFFLLPSLSIFFFNFVFSVPFNEAFVAVKIWCVNDIILVNIIHTQDMVNRVQIPYFIEIERYRFVLSNHANGIKSFFFPSSFQGGCFSWHSLIGQNIISLFQRKREGERNREGERGRL